MAALRYAAFGLLTTAWLLVCLHPSSFLQASLLLAIGFVLAAIELILQKRKWRSSREAQPSACEAILLDATLDGNDLEESTSAPSEEAASTPVRKTIVKKRKKIPKPAHSKPRRPSSPKRDAAADLSGPAGDVEFSATSSVPGPAEVTVESSATAPKSRRPCFSKPNLDTRLRQLQSEILQFQNLDMDEVEATEQMALTCRMLAIARSLDYVTPYWENASRLEATGFRILGWDEADMAPVREAVRRAAALIDGHRHRDAFAELCALRRLFASDGAAERTALRLRWFPAGGVATKRRLAEPDAASECSTADTSCEQEPSSVGAPEATGLPSIGSALHHLGTCKPCAWVAKEAGCQRGKDCSFCHLCDAGELKRRKKEKIARLRREAAAQKELAIA